MQFQKTCTELHTKALTLL